MRALALALVALLVFPSVAGAHATIVRTSPADTSVVRNAPRVVSIRWSEAVDLGPGSVRLLDAAGDEIETPDPVHAGGHQATAELALPSGLEDGTYVVAWRVTSADSHPVSGAFSFSIGAPSTLVLAEEPGESGAAIRIADGIARGVAFLGFALAVGGACVLLLLWPEGPRSRRGRRCVWAGVGLLAGATLAILLLQGPYATGGSLFDPSLLSFSLSTRFGQSLVLRLLLTATFAALVATALRRAQPSEVVGEARAVLAPPPDGDNGGGVLAPPRPREAAPAPRLRVSRVSAPLHTPRGLVLAAAACAVALAFTWTLTDHSRTGVQVWLGIPAASAHLLAMALWLGGLTLLLVSVLGRDAHASLLPVVPRFSRLALICFGVLGATGLYLAWRQSGSLAALPATGFGRLLLIKSAIVLAIIGLAAFSRRAVAQAGGDLARRLRRTVLAEVVLGVVVLGVTAALVNAAPARVSYAPPVDVTVPGVDGGEVQVHIEPAKQGENVADVYLVERGGRLLIPPEVTASLRPPRGSDDGLGPLPVELGSAEPGHYVATRMTVPYPGEWTLRLTVRTSEIDEDVIDVPVRNPMRRLLAAALALLVLAAPASAHVSILPNVARPGDTVDLTFRDPNERDDAATVGLELFLPPGVPAQIAPHPGWTHTDRGNGEIAWAPDDPANAIGHGRTQDFKVTLGPLPQTDRIVFKALQTDADGQVVRWIQSTGPDDERPAAILDLSGAGSTTEPNGAWPLFLGAGALVVVAAGFALLVMRRRRD